MNATATDDIVRDYLARVEARAAALPPDRRRELLADLAEHIATSRAEAEHDDEPTVRTILDRLGEPDEIVGVDEPAPAAVPREGPAHGGLRVAAVVIGLIVAGFVPVLGWVVGVVLVWTARGWSTRLRGIGTAVPLGFGIGFTTLVFWLGAGVAATCAGNECTSSGSGGLFVVVPILALVLVIVAAVATGMLIRGLSRRTA